MKLSQLLQGVAYESCLADPETEIEALSFDSRSCKPGTLFAAIRRESVDGHSYIDNAVAAGASVVVARQSVPGVPTVVCADTNTAFSQMCANFHGNPQQGMHLIGITGTKGKTSIAFCIKAILDRMPGVRCGLMGTVQNMAGEEILGAAHNTTPEVTELYELLDRMKAAGCTHVVMEISSHALALGRVAGLHFDCAVFTNLSQDHLNFHLTMENYLDAKAILFSQSSVSVVNIDDPASERICRAASGELLTLSTQQPASLFAQHIELLPDGVRYTLVTGEETTKVSGHTPGYFSVYNSLCALGAVQALGCDRAAAVQALADFPGVPGRAEVVEIPAAFKVIVDYAHTPDSVEKIVGTVSAFTRGRLISLVGCGGNRDRTKRPKMARAAALGSDLVILTTDNPRDEVPEEIIGEMLPGLEGTKAVSEVVVDRREAIRHAMDIAREGDTVLIMGKGHETYQEVRGVRSHFDDREEVRAYFNA